MGMFDDLIPQDGAQQGGGMFDHLVPKAAPKKEKEASIGDWIANTFGPNGNLRGSEIGSWMQGMADPVVGGVQLLANAVNDFTKTTNLSSLITGEKNGLGDKVNSRIAEKEKEYQAARAAAGRDGTDVSRIIGNVTAPTNLVAASKIPVAASLGGKALQGAAFGAGGAALDPITNTDDGYWDKKAAQTAAGAVTGAVLSPVLSKAGESIARRFVKAPVDNVTATAEAAASVKQALQEMGQNIDDIPPAQFKALVDQVQGAIKSGKKLDPAALMRKADFDALGIQPTLGQITRDPKQWAQEMNLRGVSGAGEPLLQRFTEQNQKITSGIGQFAQGAGERYQTGRKIIDELSSADDFFSKHVSSLYKQARESAGKDLDVPLQGMAQDLADVVHEFADKVPSGVLNRFREFGLDPLKPGNQTKVFTIEEANKLLKTINNHVGGDNATNLALGKLRNSVKNAVTAADSTGGPFAPAVKAAAERFSMHDAVPALKSVVEGRASPDDFVRKFIISGKADEVGSLSNILSKDAKAEAKAQIGDFLKRAAFGENVAGDKAFSQERFNKAITDLGTEKLKHFFSGAEIESIKRLGRVGSYMTSAPAKAPVNSSGSAAEAFNLLQNLPGIGRPIAAAKSVASHIVSPIRNNAISGAALKATPPVSAAPMTPVQRNMLARILAGGSFVGGGLVSPNL